MIRIILKSIQLCPVLLFQAFFQPSKAYLFFSDRKENSYIYLISLY
ncbi:hypothetical protein MHK_001531, partial [Candidatus Magnetomorum sp. HK-1]